MDGFLPPVDVGGWLDFQRKRAEQLARQRIAAANQQIGAIGQAGGDWIGQAGQRIDGLLPDWAAQPAAPPPAPSPTPSLNAPRALPPGVVGAVDWASRANDRIGGLIDQAQGIIPAGLPAGPRLPEGSSGFSASGAGLRSLGGTMIDTAERDAELTGMPGLPLPGAAGARRLAGGALQGVGNVGLQTGAQADILNREALEGDTGAAASALAQAGLGAQPSTIAGAAVHGGLMNVGAPEGVANVAGFAVEALSPNNVIDDVGELLLKGGWQIARPAVTKAVQEIGIERVPALLRRAPQALAERVGALAVRYAQEMDPSLRAGIVNAKTYDPSGINPVQGRLAARGAPGRAPGPAMLGPVEWPEKASDQAKLLRKGYGAEYTGPPLSSDPFPPGPGPNGEYTIPHPTGPEMVAAPPAPGTYLTGDGYKFWDRVTKGQTPYAADYARSVRELEQAKYPWDVYNSPPPAPGTPGYGRIDQSPLAAPDWDARLGAWTPSRGTDPTTLRHLLNRYAMNERFPQEAIDDLAPSHPDLATPEARQAALDDLNDALTQARARRSKNEDRAIASERNVRQEPGAVEEGEVAPEGTYSYTSKKGVTPEGQKGGEFHFGSSYEVASAVRFDMDPDVVSWQKGAGPRGRVRLVIDPKYGYNPNSEALMANSDPGPGSEVIYSPDFLVTFRDGTQKVVETKNVGIYNLPAWRIEAKTKAGQRHFEELWGVGFMMMAEDQIGRPFLRALAEGALNPKDPMTEWLRRVRPGDLADLQKKLRSAANASRGGGPEKEALLRDAAQHLMDLNASSKYPASVSLDDTRSVEQYLSASRAQAEWHNSTSVDGTTFSVDGQNIPLAPGLGGFMVGVTPINALRNEYPTHTLDPYRLAQFRHENSVYFDLFPDARVGTHKGVNAKGEPVTYLDVALRAPDGLSAAQAANLFRQRMVYSIDRNTNVPVARPDKQWVGKKDFTEKESYVELQRILADGERRVAAGGPAGGEFPEYRSRGGPVVRPLDPGALRAPGVARPRVPRSAAARGRGAVQGVPGAGAGDAERAGVLGAGGDVESLPGGGLPSAGAPGLPADGAGRAGLVGEGSTGITAQSGDSGWRGALDAALRSSQPYGYARTSGERLFDVTGGTVGAVGAVATSPEDATWQERAQRGVAGAINGSLVGPTLRGGLGLYGRRLLTDRSAAEAQRLGIAAGAGAGGPGGLGSRLGRALTDLPEVLSSVPLASPTSQIANFTSGMARTAERVAGVAFEGRPIDALVDLAGMVRSVPGAVKATGKAFKAGPSARTPGMLGAAAPGDLMSRGGVVPNVLTGGVRANAALDEFWRTVNEAGAGAQAARRGLSASAAGDYATKAGDFATWGGPNTIVARKLTEMKNTVRDPNADMADRIGAGLLTSMAPYVMMPERLLRATVGNLIPIEAGVGLGRALKRGDTAAAREYMGRALAGLSASYAIWKAWENGGVTGNPPENPAERRKREAEGARWNTFAVPGGARVPTRYLGSLGMQMDALATTLDAAKAAEEKGGDPGAVIENGFNAGARWFLDASYLSDLADFGSAVSGPQGAAGAIRGLAAAQPSRITGPVTNILNAADPYEREAETFPEQVAARTGLRALVPTRIDPTTGEDQRRRGTGLSRYFGERGDITTPEGDELTRLGLTPRVIGRTEKYEGAVQSREARREAQRALGREVGPAVRAQMEKSDYVGLAEEEQKARQRTALLRGGNEADIDVGEGVARGSKQQAQRAYDAIPHFVGIDPKADPDTIRRQNAQLQLAQTTASQYREKYGEGPWRSKMAKEEPELYKLVGRPRVPTPVLDNQRKKIETQYGVKLG